MLIKFLYNSNTKMSNWYLTDMVGYGIIGRVTRKKEGYKGYLINE